MNSSFLDRIKAELAEYVKSLGQVGMLRVTGIISRVLGLFLLIFTLILLVLALLTIGAVAAFDALAKCMPLWAAALVIAGADLLLIVIAIACRKQLFIEPFIKLLTKQIRTEEELELKTVEAKHQVELQRIQMTSRIDTATRELDFITTIIAQGWQYLRAFFRRK